MPAAAASIADPPAAQASSETHSVTLEVPTECVGVIIGRKCGAIKALERSTSTSIRVLRGGRGSTTRVQVTGARLCDIEAAARDLQATVARTSRERDIRRQLDASAAWHDEQRRRESAMHTQREQQRARDSEDMRAAGMRPSSLSELQAAAQRRSATIASDIAALTADHVFEVAQLWICARPSIKVIKRALVLCRGAGQAEAAAIAERGELLAFAHGWVLDDLVNWPRALVEVLLVTLSPAETETEGGVMGGRPAATEAALRDLVRCAAASRVEKSFTPGESESEESRF